jgi:dephospho-CoA kinase
MNEHAWRIGVAGYMGAGKSVVSAGLARGGAKLIAADRVAKELMTTDRATLDGLREAFGEEIVPDGVSFRRLGARVFASRSDLDTLNAIVHPPLLTRLRGLLEAAGSKRCVLDAALIPYWGIEDWFDLRIWVAASFKTRVRRLMERDGGRREDVERRVGMQQQLFAEPTGDRWTVVNNEGSVAELERATASCLPQPKWFCGRRV